MAEIDDIINAPSEIEKRMHSLSEKTRLAAEERDAEKAAREAAEAKAAEAERKVAFAEGFTDIVAENPAAKEYKADIQAKVMSGYSLEDATFAVLGKVGKLNQPKVESAPTAGGSAPTSIPQNGDKSVQEMTQQERRSALESMFGN